MSIWDNFFQEYRLTYRVFDEKFANSATVVIKISDVNDNAPKFERPTYEVHDVVEEDPEVSENNPKFLIRVSLFFISGECYFVSWQKRLL